MHINWTKNGWKQRATTTTTTRRESFEMHQIKIKRNILKDIDRLTKWTGRGIGGTREREEEVVKLNLGIVRVSYNYK